MSEMHRPTAIRERRLGEINSRHPCSTYNRMEGGLRRQLINSKAWPISTTTDTEKGIVAKVTRM
jgi:hypothetical protein